MQSLVSPFLNLVRGRARVRARARVRVRVRVRVGVRVRVRLGFGTLLAPEQPVGLEQDEALLGHTQGDGPLPG
eukprot:scaffold77399_cov76-Phaeocystis_antarctica.AAC.8